MSRLLTKD